MTTIGSLFTGYTGLDMAVEEAFGATTTWVADIDPGSCKVLAFRRPDAPNLGDITKVDWAKVTRVRILTGGFPCQDVSAGGRRAGLVKGTRSGLWHEMARAINELRPEWVVIENVRGLMSARGDAPTEDHLRAEQARDAYGHLIKWLDQRCAHAARQGRTEDARRLQQRRGRAVVNRKRAVGRARWHERRLVRAVGTVLGTLADLGYDTQWRGLRAADVGACHARWRVFIVARLADPARYGWGEGWPESAGLVGRPDVAERGHADEDGLTSILLPTPTTSNGKSKRAMTASTGNGRRTGGGQSSPPGLDVASIMAGQWPDHMPAPEDLPPSSRALLPTPEAKLGSSGADYARMNRPGTGGDSLHETVGQLNEDVALLPTPTTQDGASNGGASQFDRNTPPLNAAVMLLPTPPVADSTGGHERRGGVRGDELLLNGVAKYELLPTPMVGSSSPAAHGQISGDFRAAMDEALDRFGQYAPAIARWEAVTGLTAPSPTEPTGRVGAHRLSPRFTEFMMGLPAGWITDVPDITRNEALKLCGNGVVPQQALAAIDDCLRAFAHMAVAA